MLAIVIPYYKNAFFRECLESLVKQTNKNFNLYICNDASPEDPEQLIEEYKNRLNLTYHKFQENLGGKSLTKQWDRCLQLAGDEEWIMILGDDDILGEKVVASWYQSREEAEENTNVFRFASVIIDAQSNSVSEKYMHPIFEKPADSFYRRFTGKTRSSLSEHIFRKSSYTKYGFLNFPLAWHSDDRAWLDFSEGKPIFTINRATVFIRNSTLNISGRTDNFEDKIKASILFYEYLITQKKRLFTNKQLLEIARSRINLILQQQNSSVKEYMALAAFHLKHPDMEIYKRSLKKIPSDLKLFLRRCIK
jgi:glycosyltransferase involved in cell wall biosynthesis